MEEDKIGDKKTNDFVSFLNDEGSKHEVWVDILEINQSYIKFRTYSNSIIIIPMARVLKIKRRGDIDG